ncbi:MAG: hypothetical protein H6R01_1394 [Burkholderiaceae bacterium]|nr:hypothetical protein [Burkholderiaceae bacterium]
MNSKKTTADPMMAAIDRICASLEGSGIAGRGTSAALRAMSALWAADGQIEAGIATDDIEKAMKMLEKVRKALSRQVETSGPIKLAPKKVAQSVILSESAHLPLGTIRVSDMNFGVPRAPETEKIMISILKGSPGHYKKAAMEIVDGRAGLIEWHEKNIGPLEGGANMPIKELLETVVAAMFHWAVSS